MEKIIFFLFFCTTFTSSAQKEFYAQFKNQGCYNTVYTAIVNKKSETIIVLNSDECNTNEIYISSKILQLGDDGKIVKILKTYNTGNEAETIANIHELKDGYFIFAQSFIFSEGAHYLKFYRIDEDFKNIKSYKVLVENQAYIPYIKSFYDTLNQKIVFNYFQPDSGLNNFKSYIGTIGINCDNYKISDNIAKDSFKLALTLCNSFTNKKNYVVCYDENQAEEINSSFEYIKTLSPTSDNNNANLKQFGKDRYLMFAEESQGFPANSNLGTSNDVTVKKLDKNWKVLKNRTLGKLKGVVDTFDLVGQRSLDWHNPNKIYVGWNTFEDYDWGKSFYTQKCWTAVAQLDSNLVPKWIRYIEKENYTFQIGLVATSDNGVMLYGEQNALDSIDRYGFALKLNDIGLLSEEKAPLENIFVSVGPNPFVSQITFAVGTPISIGTELKVAFFDVQGRFLQKENLNEGFNKINLSILPSATYFYQVLYKGKSIKQGKVVKL